jgi:hypothetical protein
MSKPKIKLSIPTGAFGWTDPRGVYDPRMPNFGEVTYTYEVRPTAWHAWVPGCKWEVVKQSLVHQAVDEVLAVVDSREVAEGFIKLLKEN